MEPTCVNLAERFPRYRISWEADGVTKPDWPREDWPWLMEIRCRYGLVHPHGGTLLTAFITSAKIASKVGALPFIQRTIGDLTEFRAWFDVDHAEEVFRLLKPRRKQTPRDASRLTKYRFLPAQNTTTESQEVLDEGEPANTLEPAA